jgi:hypothetical protein
MIVAHLIALFFIASPISARRPVYPALGEDWYVRRRGSLVDVRTVSHTPRHAIREWLAGLRGTWYPPGTEPSRMLPDTVRFLRCRDLPPRQMWYVTCEADAGSRGAERWSWTVEALRDDQGRWSANGINGSSGGPCILGRPWANLGGNWGSRGFRAGGTVEDAGAGVMRVRLTDRGGRMFEDTVENGVVLFSSEEPVAMPMHLELIDAEGRVIDADEWGFVDE